MPTAGEISVLGKQYGESDWRELRKRIGLVSSSVRQMMAEDEPALETVASGKYAMIDFWGRITRAEKAQALKLLRQIECLYLADRPWSVLSQGERQQRVPLPRAPHGPAPLVLILSTNHARASIPSRGKIFSNSSSASAGTKMPPHSSSSPIMWKRSCPPSRMSWS